MNFGFKFLFGIMFMSIFCYGVLALTVEQTVTVDVVPGKINIFSPQAQVYTSRMVPINISLSDNATFRYAKYSDNNDGLVTLCRDCFEYGEHNINVKPFNDGFHRMRIVAEFEGGTVEQFVEFFVDSKKPVIHKVSPVDGFANGTFVVEFTEENSASVALFYGNLDEIRNTTIEPDNCTENFFGKMRCTVNVDLADFDGEDIFYGFTVLDIANHTTLSQIKRLTVDMSAPTVDSFDLNVDGRRVEFIFSITEDNFKEIRSIDWNAFFPRWRTLCTTLSSGMCIKEVTFFSGEHDVSFEIRDEAGNSAFLDNVLFSVA